MTVDDPVRPIPAASRVGFGFFMSDVPSTLDLIERAEQAGVETAWMVMPPAGYDTVTVAAAALARTSRIRVGTSILPAFTRHPLNLATQAMALDAVAPGRFRLGVGTGNLAVMADSFGTPITRPAGQLREYVEVVRTALNHGEVHVQGSFYAVDATLPQAAPMAVTVAALGPRLYSVAGEVADAAMSWHSPLAYLDNVARPALQAGAEAASRRVPPIITQVTTIVSTDRAEVRGVARPLLRGFAANDQYARMYAAAGLAVGRDGTPSDELIDALIVSGDESAVTDRLGELAEQRDELLVALPWPSGAHRDDEDTILRVLGNVSRSLGTAAVAAAR